MKSLTINNKNIYIVNEHHQVLEAWEQFKGSDVITFDFHNDTIGAFLRYASWLDEPDKTIIRKTPEEIESIQKNLINSYPKNNGINEIISKLNNDEHITFAVYSGLINNIYVCAHEDSYNYKYYDSIYNINHYLWCECRKRDYGSNILDKINFPNPETDFYYPYNGQKIIECSLRAHSIEDLNGELLCIDDNLVLDDITLKPLFANYKFFNKNSLNNSYIVDFDMDYFFTKSSINPLHRSYINKLIKESVAITIATEDDCSANNWKDIDPINYEENINLLLNLISEANL